MIGLEGWVLKDGLQNGFQRNFERERTVYIHMLWSRTLYAARVHSIHDGQADRPK
ncbi:MAG: hypothetical protein K0Q81_1263 [Paenibacillus sp.]|nr:hypothetical protein [Paenibacillus sp.]